MDVSSIAALATDMSQAKTAQAVGTAVFKKALDLEQQAAMQLIAALPAVQATNPPHLGQTIDVLA